MSEQIRWENHQMENARNIEDLACFMLHDEPSEDVLISEYATDYQIQKIVEVSGLLLQLPCLALSS